MRLFIIALCAMGLSIAVKAQTTPASSTPPSPSAAATEIVPTTTADNARYISNPRMLVECTQRLSGMADKPCDMIFIGDGTTSGWLGIGRAVWDKVYAPRHALNFGIAGDTIQNVLWRLSNMDVQSIKPKIAVIMIGAENADANTHGIADGVKAVVANTQESFPGVKIILVSILPNAAAAADKITQANSLLKTLADDNSVYYLDLASKLPPVTADSNTKSTGTDQSSLDATGYQTWADAMEPLVTKIMASVN